MEKSLIQFTENYLGNLKHRMPIPTGIKPDFHALPGIKAVLFDIYGTLLISSSGDVDIDSISESNVLAALTMAHIQLLHTDKTKIVMLLRALLFETITRIHEERKKSGIPYPEINIINIWQQVFESQKGKDLVKIPETFSCKEFAFIFELFNNPISPMPDLREILSSLSKKNLILGIISNAQFYTPVLLNYFLTDNIVDSEDIHLFSNKYVFFSYKYLRGKPDIFLFEKAKETFSRIPLQPEQILYVGNDMQKDIIPAKSTGFKTVLFAGDKRSLRLHGINPESEKTKPDAIITELSQVRAIIEPLTKIPK